MDRVRNRQTGKDRPRIRDKQADGGKVRRKQIHRESINWNQERQRYIKRDTEAKTGGLAGRQTSGMSQRHKKKDGCRPRAMRGQMLVANLGCQFDCILNPLKPKMLDTPVSFLDQII